MGEDILKDIFNFMCDDDDDDDKVERTVRGKTVPGKHVFRAVRGGKNETLYHMSLGYIDAVDNGHRDFRHVT